MIFLTAKTDAINTHGTSYLMKRFAPYFKPYRHILCLDLFCAAMTTLCDLVLPQIVSYITDTGIRDLSALTLQTIFMLGGLYLLLRVIDVFANYYMANIGHVMGARIETDMRSDLFNHMEDLSYSYYSNTKVGQLMSRITNDLFEVTEFAHHCPEEYFIAALKITVSFIILCTANVPLTLIVFAIIPFMIFFAGRYSRKMRTAFKKSKNQIGEVNSQVEDTLLGIRVVKSFANEDIELSKFKKGNDRFVESKKESYRYMGLYNSGLGAFTTLINVIVIASGAFFITRSIISVTDLITFLLYISNFTEPIKKLISFTEQFQNGASGYTRFLEILNVCPDIVDRPKAIELKNAKGDITFQNVSFQYEDTTEAVLSHINLHIKEGEYIALVGTSGVGKSTLCSLIPRFYEVTEGQILIDGRDVRDFTMRSLRNNIGIVQQDVYLFAGTVMDNIRYGRPDASDEEIVQAARNANAHEFIMNLPDGYDTYIGQRGIKLSGGQKQRLSIARVFLKNPPILIFDEATSALDNESEKVVQESLEKLAKNRTTLVIAHRLSTIRNAERILVLTENGIAESGNHEELLAKNGIYAELYNMQFRK